MAAPPDFSEKTVQTLMARACMICSNPKCSTVTLGPSDANGSLAIKLGGLPTFGLPDPDRDSTQPQIGHKTRPSRRLRRFQSLTPA